jgi:hypothetical protein
MKSFCYAASRLKKEELEENEDLWNTHRIASYTSSYHRDYLGNLCNRDLGCKLAKTHRIQVVAENVVPVSGTSIAATVSCHKTRLVNVP